MYQIFLSVGCQFKNNPMLWQISDTVKIIRRDKNNVTNTKNSHKFKATFILIFRIDYIANWEGTF